MENIHVCRVGQRNDRRLWTLARQLSPCSLALCIPCRSGPASVSLWDGRLRSSWRTYTTYTSSTGSVGDEGSAGGKGEFIRVGRAEEFANFADVEPSGEEEDNESEGESSQRRQEQIEKMKDRFFKFVDLPNGKKAMVFRYNDRFYAPNALCPHRGAELYLGEVDEIKDDDMGIVWGHSLTCPLHNWVFDLQDGSCNMKRYVLDVYEVKQEAGEVFISTEPSNKEALNKVSPPTPPSKPTDRDQRKSSPAEAAPPSRSPEVGGDSPERSNLSVRSSGPVQFEFWRG